MQPLLKRKSFSRLTAVVILLGVLVARAGEQKSGPWKTLFDGKATAGWRSFGKPDFPKRGWAVEDGCLHLLPNSGGGDIITVEKFTDFEFDWDWRINSKGNNGIKYLVTEDRPNTPGPEYQMVDDTTVPDPKQQTASFYGVLPPQVKTPVKPPGEWNHSRLVIQGTRVEHWLNGVKVLTYELGSAEVKAAVAQSKFKTAPGFGEKITGHILLTDHHDETWFRNLSIRELRAK